MRAPYRFAYPPNLVFGQDLEDVWALYALEMRSYDSLSVTEKQGLLSELEAFAYAAEADVHLLRVSQAWSTQGYLAQAEGLCDPGFGHGARWADYLEGHRRALSLRATARPRAFVAIRLERARSSQTAALLGEGLSALVAKARGFLGDGDPRGITQRRLEELLGREQEAFARALDYLDCERASTQEFEWLVRRAFCRGLGEPDLDPHWAPQALVFPDERDARRYVPLEADMLRLVDSPIEVGERSLRICCEQGTSHQGLLCFGALPETVPFPGRQAELLFAPLESLEFSVDAALHLTYLPNDEAVALTRRKIVDADNTYAEESHGDHGPSGPSTRRPELARELEDYLTAGDRPPLLRGTITLALGADSEELLEERVERLRREYAGIKLHRPFGDQLGLFLSHLPAQPCRVAGYEDVLTVEQVGAMVPTATHAVGSDEGAYIGYTLSGSRQPVLLDLTEASRTSRPPAIFLVGTPGSGKTIFLQLLLYQAFLQGSRVVDFDAKGDGDHKLAGLPGVAEQLERIELTGDERFRGLLDPLRIAPEGLEEDLATSFLVDIAPSGETSPTEVRAALRCVLEAEGARATCGAVIEELKQGNPEAKRSARQLEVYADTGLARLGFAEPGSAPPDAGHRQVTMLGIRHLARPLAGTPRSELQEDELIGQAVLRLMAAYAMDLVGRDPGRHAAVGIDEAYFLLWDATGRRLIERLNRMGRSLYTTPILATQTVEEAADLDNLIGARFAFGMETEREAGKALGLLGLDADDEDLRGRLTRYRAGRCLMRDWQGRVSGVQIDLVDDELLDALDTTPGRPGEAEQEADEGDEPLAA